MAEQTNIEWADSTFNPWMGCTKVSPACDHCYAETLMDKRHGKVKWGPHGERVRTSEGNWQNPRRWQRQAAEFAAEHSRRRRVFCASLADVFDNKAPAGARDDLWTLIRETPDLDWLLLTKRPQNIEKMLPVFWPEITGHVWLGTSTENQEETDRRLPHLLAVTPRPAVFFASAEPLLGPIDFRTITIRRDGGRPTDISNRLGDYIQPLRGNFTDSPRLDWIIAGGESGPRARPTHPDWTRSIRDQCAEAGTAFLFKQWGEWALLEDRFNSREQHAIACDGTVYRSQDLAHPDGVRRGEAIRSGHDSAHLTAVYRVGKKAAGRELDGATHNGFPQVQRQFP